MPLALKQSSLGNNQLRELRIPAKTDDTEVRDVGI